MPEDSLELKENLKLKIDNKAEKTLNIPFSYITEHDRNENLGSIIIEAEFIYDKNYDEPVLVIPKSSGFGARVFINEKFIGGKGDMRKGQSSMRTLAKAFNIDNQLLKVNDKNYIRLEIKSLYKAELLAPLFIAESGAAFKYVFLINLINTLSLSFAVGFMFFMGILIIIIRKYLLKSKNGFYAFGAAFVFIAVYFIDFLYIEFLPFRYAILKKITLSSLYLAGIFSLVGIGIYLEKKINLAAKITIILFAASIAGFLVLPADMHSLSNFYRKSNFLFFLFFLNLFYVTGKNLTNKKKSLPIFLCFVFALPFVVKDVVCFFYEDYVLFLNYGAVLICFIPGVLIFYEIQNIYLKMLKEKERADLLYKQSLRDPLTKAFNRKLLDFIDDMIEEKCSVLIFDLDKFKNINDKYGHAAGDETLKNFMKVLRAHIRKTDYIIRYGGDEFVVLLNDCSLEVAARLAKNIQKDIRKQKVQTNKTSFSFNCSIGAAEFEKDDDFQKVFERADKKLYLAKNKGRGKVCF
ncbi:MAG: GGDEF domain-containing protein [Spirochaetia bacterium]|nr:GGDEF domain-containing protein [Spirochaetia bacterium]